MLLEEGTWLLTVFAEVADNDGVSVSAGTGADAPRLNIEVQSPYATMDNIFELPVGVTACKKTVTTTVLTAGSATGERRLHVRGYAQWDKNGNAGQAFDARVDLQVFLTKIGQAPVYA
jgi:hypothetical protein